jgi:hypothetical protein
MVIYSIPEKLDIIWMPEILAIVNVWTSFTVSINEYKNAILEHGIIFAKTNKAVAWIVDSSGATGSFSEDIHSLIINEVFPSFTKCGIKYYITIKSKISRSAKTTVAGYLSKIGPHGLTIVDVDSLGDAVKWMKGY